MTVQFIALLAGRIQRNRGVLTRAIVLAMMITLRKHSQVTGGEKAGDKAEGAVNRWRVDRPKVLIPSRRTKRVLIPVAFERG